VALYNATNGPQWNNNDNWLETSEPSTWFGVTVSEGHVTALNFAMNGLNGPLPAEIGDLSHLIDLGIAMDQLAGPLPAALGTLAHLQTLDLCENAITGSLPDLSGLASLEVLALFGNQLSGPLPETWGQPLLREAWLSDNVFSGTIPTRLRQLPNLSQLDLSRNSLEGPVPGDWDAPNLRSLNLDGNGFTSLPASWGYLPQLGVLNATDNHIGTLPADIAFPQSLMYLYLDNNEIGSPLPASLADQNLFWLALNDNRLTGPLPIWLPQIDNLVSVEFSGNAFTGPIPAEYGDLGVWRLDLSDNLLSGEIPWQLGLIGRQEPDGTRSYMLELLLLSGNRLSGTLSEEFLAAIGRQSRLAILDLSDNQLSGTIPSAISALGSAAVVRLGGNHFCGTIPPQLGQMSGLRQLLVGSNHLSGPIPAEIGALAELENLDLAANALEGALPVEIAAVSSCSWPWCGAYPEVCWWDLSWNRLDVESTDPELRTLVSERDGDWEATQWPQFDAAGSGVSSWLGGQLQVKYGEVMATGETSVITFPEDPAASPAGYEMMPVYFEVMTTSQYDPSQGVDITVPYSDCGLTAEEEGRLVLLNLYEGQWTDCTIGRDNSANTLAGHTQTLGTYVVALGPANDAPTLGEIVVPVDPIPLGAVVGAEANFSDADAGDTHTASWDWGDGSTSVGAVDQEADRVTGQHLYGVPGVYTVKLTVGDAAGETASAEYRYLVVYDPEGGFVTGGGWIRSPEGAYAADPALTGKASFGFVSKYKKGATVPTGETEFQFRAGDLDFHSASYDWLVVAGAKAMYKGVGTIDGQGHYGFMLSAIDAKLTPSTEVDLFRIKIWDKDNGDAVVYDNQMDAAEDADPSTAVGGGSIVVHKR
jgi:Leucine-rich repeat (LRR) protein